MAERRLTDEENRKLQQRIMNDQIVAARLANFYNLPGLNIEGVERNPTGFYRQRVLPPAINIPIDPFIPGREERPTPQEIAEVALSNTHLDPLGNPYTDYDRTFDELARRYPSEQNLIEQLQYKAHAINLGVDRMIERWKRALGGNNLTNAQLDAIRALLPAGRVASAEELETLMHRFKPTVTIWSIIKNAVKFQMYKALVIVGNINRELDKMISKYPSLMSCLTIACFPRKYHPGDEYCKLSGNIKCASETCCNIITVYLGGIISNAIFEEIMRQISMIPEMVISKQPEALGGKGKTKKHKTKKHKTKQLKRTPNNKKGLKKQKGNIKTKNNRR